MLVGGCGGKNQSSNVDPEKEEPSNEPGQIDIDDDASHYGGVEVSGTNGLTYGGTYKVDDQGNVSFGYTVTGYRGSSTKVVIPEKFNGYPVYEVAQYAFQNNLIIESITLGKNVYDIGAYAFSRTFNLKKIEVAKGNNYLKVEDDIVYHVEDGVKVMYFGDAQRYTAFDAINKGITSLERGCFGNFENLLYLRYSLSQYNGRLSRLFNVEASSAQYYKDRMKNNYVPNLATVHLVGADDKKEVPDYFAEYCYSLKSIILENMLYIGKYAFSNCILLNNITLPMDPNKDKIASIGAFAFEYCKSLYKMFIPNTNLSYITLGDSIFKECRNLYKHGYVYCEFAKSKFQFATSESASFFVYSDNYTYTLSSGIKYNQTYKAYQEFDAGYLDPVVIPDDPGANS